MSAVPLAFPFADGPWAVDFPWMPWRPWVRVDKGERRARVLADKHYTRQSPGHPMFTRPGYNFVLYTEVGDVRACFVWWRPKWEAGQERKDGLRCLECTIFRREGPRDAEPVASALVLAAVHALKMPVALDDLAGVVDPPDGLITGVGTEQTRKRRSKRSLPGKCFREAGFVEFDHKKGRADVWLKYGGT